MAKLGRFTVIAGGTLVLLAVVSGVWINATLQDEGGANEISGNASSPGAGNRMTNGNGNANGGNAFLAQNQNLSFARTPAPNDVDIQVLDSARWKARGKDPLLNSDLMRIFDQIIGRFSGVPLEQIAGHVAPEYVERAQKLLAQYLRYKEDLANLALTPMGAGKTASEVLAAVITERFNVQQQHFSEAEITGLFAEDNQYDAFTVERLRTVERSDLDDAQKQAAIAKLSSAMLTAEQQEARQAGLLPAQIIAHNDAMDKANATSEQRLEMRSAAFGADAAVRMAEVDRREAEWQQRIAQLAKAEPALQLQMRQSLFTPTEQQRLDGALALYQFRGAASKP